MIFSFFPNFSNFLDFLLCLAIFYSFSNIGRWLNLKNFKNEFSALKYIRSVFNPDQKNFQNFLARIKTIFRVFS